MLLEILIAATLAVNVIGGGLLVKWLVHHIKALEGTVKAQGETLRTIGTLNDTLLKVLGALDPERWAKEVTVYKDLTDKKVAALMEEAERKFRAERGVFAGHTVDAIDRMWDMYGEAIEVVLRYMPWVPKGHRVQVITETKLPDIMKKKLTDMAVESPEWPTALGSDGLLGLLVSGGGSSGLTGLLAKEGYAAAARAYAEEKPTGGAEGDK